MENELINLACIFLYHLSFDFDFSNIVNIVHKLFTPVDKRIHALYHKKVFCGQSRVLFDIFTCLLLLLSFGIVQDFCLFLATYFTFCSF